MNLHGLECTDPVRQFNDYGYTTCSTVTGINCSIWDSIERRPFDLRVALPDAN